MITSCALLLLFFFSSLQEKEKRAAILFAIFFIANTLLWLSLIYYNHFPFVYTINKGLLVFAAVFALLSLISYFPSRPTRDLSNPRIYDERDMMFSRNRLKFNPQLAQAYYSGHPEKKETDMKIHDKPEIGTQGGHYYNQLYSPVFDAAFTYLHRTQDVSRGEVSSPQSHQDKEVITQVIHDIAKLYDAVDIGITPLEPYHFYSHKGRRAEHWGEPVQNTHHFGILIVVAMDVKRMKSAPSLPVTVETSKQYVEAAKIANIIAQYIRSLGYEATAHTDGNYEVLCVPLAVDAGLGVLGRLGIFMHPVYGPCVRLSVVTTTLELNPTPAKTYTMEYFCDICKKCADNCPSHSIEKKLEPISRGFAHWGINQETCFSFWKSIGTDCGFCIRVCPYTKPNTFVHKLVRFYISGNPLNQRIALFMDDLFYGRKISIPTRNPLNSITC